VEQLWNGLFLGKNRPFWWILGSFCGFETHSTTFLALNGRHKLLPRSVRSMIIGILQFFPALVHTPASAPALNPVILARKK